MIQLCMVFIRMIDGFPLWQGSPFRNQSQVSNSFRYESGVRKVLDARLKFVVNTFRSSSRFRQATETLDLPWEADALGAEGGYSGSAQASMRPLTIIGTEHNIDLVVLSPEPESLESSCQLLV
eukprot:g9416.t1